MAAVRETEEETGLVVRLGPPLPESRYTRPRPGRRARRQGRAVLVRPGHRRRRPPAQRDRRGRLARRRRAPTRASTTPATASSCSPSSACSRPTGSTRGRSSSSGTRTPSPRGAWKRRRPPAPARPAGPGAGRRRSRDVLARLRRDPRRQLALRAVPGHRRAVCRVRRAAAAHPRRRCPRRGSRPTPRRPHGTWPGCCERGEPALLCTHGPVLPALLDDLARRLDLDGAGSVEVVEEFAEARDDKLFKGEALVCHVVGRGAGARVVAVERHRALSRTAARPHPAPAAAPPRPDRPDDECPDAVHGAFTRRGSMRHPASLPSLDVGQRSPGPLTLVLREVHTVKIQRFGAPPRSPWSAPSRCPPVAASRPPAAPTAAPAPAPPP